MRSVDLGSLADPCAVCRFHGDQYTDVDIDGTLRSIAFRWEWLVEGAPDHALRTAPPGTATSVDDLRTASAEAVTALDGAGDRRARLAAAHAGGHALHLAGRVLAAVGASPSRARGTVTGLFASDGGVPKLPIATARIGYRGLAGDRQAARQHHGRVWQALCVYSADVVDALARDGHPIAPGCAGENVSIGGIDWTAVRPGVQLRIGEALVEVTSYSTPCAKNAQWFVDRDFNRMDHARHPGWSRVYAAVLEDGIAIVGDQATLEP